MKKVFMRPLIGLARQHLLLPLWALTGNCASFEWLLLANGADAVTTTHPLLAGSLDWSIASVKIHMDILNVDEALVSIILRIC